MDGYGLVMPTKPVGHGHGLGDRTRTAPSSIASCTGVIVTRRSASDRHMDRPRMRRVGLTGVS